MPYPIGWDYSPKRIRAEPELTFETMQSIVRCVRREAWLCGTATGQPTGESLDTFLRPEVGPPITEALVGTPRFSCAAVLPPHAVNNAAIIMGKRIWDLYIVVSFRIHI